MHSADIFTADEVVGFFEASLREEGFENVEIAHYTDHQRMIEEFYIQHKMVDEELTYKASFNFEMLEPDEIKTQIAQEVKNIVRNFKEYMVETFSWDERTVQVSTYNGGWARCMNCETRIHFPSEALRQFTEDAELSCPNPRPRDRKRAVAELSGHNEVLFKMYLIGRLREECDFNCRNHKYSQ